MAMNHEERIRFANLEILEKGNLGVLAEIFAPTYHVHANGREYKGHKCIEGFIGQLRSAIPEIKVVHVELLLEASDTVVWQRTLSGKHEADMMGIPPSHKKVQWMDMMVTRFDGEKIAEEWTVSDLAGQLMLKLPAR